MHCKHCAYFATNTATETHNVLMLQQIVYESFVCW